MDETNETRPFRILIVDDDEAIRLVLTQALQKAGYQVLEAENGLAALAMIGPDAPDLMISDLCMPVMGGMALLEQVREVSARRDLPIIILTGRGGDAEAECLDRGADDFIAKPFAVAELAARVRSLLRRGTRIS